MVEDCWEGCPTSTNKEVDHEFIIKEYIFIGIRP